MYLSLKSAPHDVTTKQTRSAKRTCFEPVYLDPALNVLRINSITLHQSMFIYIVDHCYCLSTILFIIKLKIIKVSNY